jgi:hypothetical protein
MGGHSLNNSENPYAPSSSGKKTILYAVSGADGRNA